MLELERHAWWNIMHDSPKLPNRPEFKAPVERHPVAAFFGVLLAVVVIAVGSYAIYAWEHQKVKDLSVQARDLQSTTSELQQKITAAQASTTAGGSGSAASGGVSTLPTEVGITLDSGAVSFSFPHDWIKATAAGLNVACVGSATGSAVCQDVATIVPSGFDNNTSGFSLSVKVFQNSGNTDAKDWFINAYGGSWPMASEGDQISAQNINGYSAYYFLQNDMPAYKDVYYTIVGHGHAVVLYARVYQSPQSGDQTVHDFTQYLPDIQTFANSIKFEGN